MGITLRLGRTVMTGLRPGAILLALALVLGLGGGAGAQETAPPRAAPPSPTPPAGAAPLSPAPTAKAAAPTAFAEYRVRLGDRLRFSMWGEPGLSGELTVMPDGTVSWPMVGLREVVGKTVPELLTELQEAYRRYFRDPRISLSCIPRSPPQVYFEGAVGRPGPVDYDPRLRLLDYLGLVGGPAPGADLSRVVITSVSDADVTKRVLDVSLASAGRAPESNPPLTPGDTVWIGRALPVSVVGAVNAPGAFEYRGGLRLSDYFALAGGPTNRANLRQAVLKHSSPGADSTRVIDLTAALRAPDSDQTNPILAPGDVVSVPEAFVGGGLEWSDILRGITSALIFWH